MPLSLEELAEEIRRCTRCPLASSRRMAVPGEGPEDAECMLIGESPGSEEDRTGRPFVGRSGRFLDEALGSLGLSRSHFFITGSVKCHPPHNRAPTSAEISACRPFLERQIEVVDPRVIVLLGSVAARTILGLRRLSDVRGKLASWNSRIVLPTFHPASAMRFPGARKAFMEDLKLLASLL